MARVAHLEQVLAEVRVVDRPRRVARPGPLARHAARARSAPRWRCPRGRGRAAACAARRAERRRRLRAAGRGASDGLRADLSTERPRTGSAARDGGSLGGRRKTVAAPEATMRSPCLALVLAALLVLPAGPLEAGSVPSRTRLAHGRVAERHRLAGRDRDADGGRQRHGRGRRRRVRARGGAPRRGQHRRGRVPAGAPGGRPGSGLRLPRDGARRRLADDVLRRRPLRPAAAPRSHLSVGVPGHGRRAADGVAGLRPPAVEGSCCSRRSPSPARASWSRTASRARCARCCRR